MVQQVTSVPLTAVAQRRIRAGFEEQFETLMQEFIAHVLRQPGHVGINVFRQPGDPRSYTIVDRFATEQDRRTFTASAEYTEWMRRLRELSEGDPVIEELQGLSFWFTLPNRAATPRPPTWKMALLTLLGVYPLTMILPAIYAPLVRAWPHWAQGLLIGATIVALLTWVVMPAITRTFERWLFPGHR